MKYLIGFALAVFLFATCAEVDLPQVYYCVQRLNDQDQVIFQAISYAEPRMADEVAGLYYYPNRLNTYESTPLIGEKFNTYLVTTPVDCARIGGT